MRSCSSMGVATASRRVKFWGWGYEDRQPSAEEIRGAAAGIREHLGFEPADAELPVELDAIELPEPRLKPTSAMEGICSTDVYERVSHAQGKGYRDVVRAFRGQIEHPPDVVAYPRDESDVVALLGWCADAGAAAIPYGGGTRVVGGVEPRLGGFFAGGVSIVLRSLDRVLDY